MIQLAVYVADLYVLVEVSTNPFHAHCRLAHSSPPFGRGTSPCRQKNLLQSKMRQRAPDIRHVLLSLEHWYCPLLQPNAVLPYVLLRVILAPPLQPPPVVFASSVPRRFNVNVSYINLYMYPVRLYRHSSIHARPGSNTRHAPRATKHG